MSFILDALKKSESTRQRQAGPSLFEVKVTAPRRGLPGWALGLGVLLLVNAAVLGWILLHHPAPAASVKVQATPQAVPGGEAHGPAGPPGRALSATPRASGGRPANPTAAPGHVSLPHSPAMNPGGPQANAPAGPGSPGEAQQAVPGADTNSADFAPAIQPPAQSGSGAQEAATGLPRYRDLTATPGVDLPSLHLDLHVYDENARKRYVMINMRTLRQGDSLPDGVEVVSIRPDGVVLSYGGRKFLLAR